MATTPKFIVLTGPEEGQELSLEQKDQVQLGRAEDNDLVLSDTSVSRHHATVMYAGGTYSIQDNGSSNGTQVNQLAVNLGNSQTLKSGDVIQMGIYELRCEGFPEPAQTPGAPKDEQPAEASAAVVDDLQPQESTQSERKDDDEGHVSLSDARLETNMDELQDVKKSDDDILDTPSLGKGLVVFLVIGALVSLLAISIHSTQDTTDTAAVEPSDSQPEVQDTKQEAQDTKQVEQAKKSEQTAAEQPIEDVSVVSPVESAKQPVDLSRPYRVFLDVQTKPFPATIYYGEERLGRSPIKTNIEIKPGDVHELYADFELRELDDIYRKKVSFDVSPDKDVVDLDIEAEIAVLKIQKLPRRVDFYLEGYYAYDNLKANPVKITDIVYGKPIYLPFGKYVMELREQVAVAGSEKPITKIRYQREYTLDGDNHTLDLQVADKDLQFFPAVIRSVPSGADVYYDNKLMGQTPYKGSLEIGIHKLKIQKDGYFEKVVDIHLDRNSVYQRTFELKTSKMGEKIQEAKEKIRHGQEKQAISVLVDALKYGGSAREKAETYFLLAEVYLRQKNFSNAKPYFEKAMQHTDFENRAKLGVVQCDIGLKNNAAALTRMVEVLANMTDDSPASFRAEADTVFKKLSPVKSVIYIHTDPTGASVYINDKLIEQKSPMILSDLGLGSYRIRIDKPGYEAFQTKQNLKISEFVMVKVNLKAENL